MVFLLLGSVVFAAPAPTKDPMSRAAEYYFSRHDYRQSFQLWADVLKREPQSMEAAFRVAELKLMFEGRGAARSVLKQFLETNGELLSVDAKKQVQGKLSILANTFVSDEGQSNFFPALPRVARKDCAGAMPLLNQAIYFEKGNVRILKERAKCEKILGTYDKYYETLKLAYDNNPYDSDVVENLMEAHVYFLQYHKVLEMAHPKEEAFRSLRSRRALAYALFQTGANSQALAQFQGLMEAARASSVHPITLYALGKLFAARLGGAGEAVPFLERFLVASTRPELALIDGWDPYHSADKLTEAQQILVSIKKT